ncbi:acyloxyacyl hydrolase [Pleomorphomonas oryzae]|uniref:acyloxyacyl hydrolase n=1 Tax=Pleomorphomonas oryzae TaxID=261934 RepID=UPI0006853416|nr:acyloxyacyl hydrolase [Pleomorphomonas oryzae]
MIWKFTGGKAGAEPRVNFGALTLGLVFLLSVNLIAQTARASGTSSSDQTRVDQDFKLIGEVRLGGSAHNPTGREHGADITAEILSTPIFKSTGSDWFRWFVPRLGVGGALNTRGRTSYVHSGLVWTIPLSDSFFIEGQFGLALHDAKFGNRRYDNLGNCNWSFREGAFLGYRLDSTWAIVGGVDHLSQAGLCDGGNAGLTNYRIELSHAF